MSYTLKSIRYHNEPRKILLQNENGPCPLLAAANALLLRGVIQLPPACLQTNHASIDDVVNTLAERALRNSNPNSNSNSNTNSNSNLKSNSAPANKNEFKNENENENENVTEDGRAYQINELLSIFPKLQDGMDVNPKLASGPTGVEYTKNLTAFDLMGVELVHGWLVDSKDGLTKNVIGTRTYNELVEIVVMGGEAEKEMERLEGEIDALEKEIEALGQVQQHPPLLQDKPKPDKLDGDKDENEMDGDSPLLDKHDKLDAGSPLLDKKNGHKVEADAETNKAHTPTDQDEKAEVEVQEKQQHKEHEHEEEWVDVSPSIEEKSTSSAGVTPVPSNTSETTEPEKNDVDLTAVKDFMYNLDNELELDARVGPVLLADGKRRTLDATRQEREEQKRRRTDGSIVNSFLTETSNQLTESGLAELQLYVMESSVCVFFRNNHFATMTKEDGVLYLLVTDVGYASVNEVVWEKLDNITGDTKYTDELFETSKPREQSEVSSEVDLQLALQLSRDGSTMDTQEQQQVATAIEASMLEETKRVTADGAAMKLEEVVAKKVRDDDAASELLARKLQAEESSPNPDYVQGRNQKQGCIIS